MPFRYPTVCLPLRKCLKRHLRPAKFRPDSFASPSSATPVHVGLEVGQCLVCSAQRIAWEIPSSFTYFIFKLTYPTAESNSEDTGPSVVVGSSSPPSVGYSHHHRSLHEHADPSLPVQPIQQTEKRLRFPRFLRRTHSASASTEAPPYALFLRTKRASHFMLSRCRD